MNHDKIDDEDEDMSQDSDDHETPERKRKAKHPPAKTTKTKRPKVDGAALTIRSALKAKKARSNIRKSDAIDDSGLYGMRRNLVPLSTIMLTANCQARSSAITSLLMLSLSNG